MGRHGITASVHRCAGMTSVRGVGGSKAGGAMQLSRGLVVSLLLCRTAMVHAEDPGAPAEPNSVIASVGSTQVSLAEPAAGTSTAEPGGEPKSGGGRRPIYVWGSAGLTFAYGKTFWNLGVGGGYFLAAGLLPNVELSRAFGSSPAFTAFRPGVTWFVPLPFHPFVGAYYTHWFVTGDRGDRDGFGGRAGLSFLPFLSLALSYDHSFNCSRDCEAWTPQVTAGLSF
jgi:hypothetical protein